MDGWRREAGSEGRIEGDGRGQNDHQVEERWGRGWRD